jgi:uncharacterized membrane protein
MNRIMSAVSVIFILIALYLVLTKSKDTVSIISTFASNANKGIAVLQGREVSKVTL